MTILRRTLLGLAFSLLAATAQSTTNLQTALFAGGCFWTMQHGMEEVPGVVRVVAGYSGGREAHPTYQQVSSETTGHRETVQVTFDPARISYAALVQRYFRLTDPTQADGQACDHGPSYRPAIFVTPQQRPIAEAAKAQVGALLQRPIATAVLPAGPFWPAEAYHQDYARRNVAAYTAYRIGCGRDGRLAALWRGR